MVVRHGQGEPVVLPPPPLCGQLYPCGQLTLPNRKLTNAQENSLSFSFLPFFFLSLYFAFLPFFLSLNSEIQGTLVWSNNVFMEKVGRLSALGPDIAGRSSTVPENCCWTAPRKDFFQEN